MLGNIIFNDFRHYTPFNPNPSFCVELFTFCTFMKFKKDLKKDFAYINSVDFLKISWYFKDK